MKIANVKTLLIGLVACAAFATQAQVAFQPIQLGQATTAGWTNRLAGSTSMTNYYRIDIGPAKEVAIEAEIQGTAASMNGQFWIGRSVNRNPTGGTNTIDLFSTFTLAGSGSANTTVAGHTNFSDYTTGNQSIAGYRYLWIGPISNTAAGGNYITNMTIFIDAF